MSERKKSKFVRLTWIGMASLLALLAVYVSAYLMLVDVLTYASLPFGERKSIAVYHVGNHALGDWVNTMLIRIASQRGIACSDWLSLRKFLGVAPTEESPRGTGGATHNWERRTDSAGSLFPGP
jgi:hypothetical protein